MAESHPTGEEGKVPPVKPRSVRLPDDLWARVEQEAESRNVSIAHVLREALTAQLVRQVRQRDLDRMDRIEARLKIIERRLKITPPVITPEP